MKCFTSSMCTTETRLKDERMWTRNKATGREKHDKKTSLNPSWLPLWLMTEWVCAAKKTQEREVRDSDEDYEEWLTPSWNTCQRFLQRHLQHVTLPAAQHAVTTQQLWMENSWTPAKRTIQQSSKHRLNGSQVNIRLFRGNSAPKHCKVNFKFSWKIR